MPGPDPQSEPLANYRLTIRYDGRDYLGWQRNGAQPTVQYVLEGAVTAAYQIRSVVQGSGRTDRGAHAMGQVATVRLPPGLDRGDIVAALNAELPDAIEVLDAQSVASDFHARASATGKRYRYVIWSSADCPPAEVGRVWHVTGDLDVGAMREACAVLLGRNDFASFATRPNYRQKSTERELRELTLEQDGPRLDFVFCADGFLYKMVRNIVRALVKVGEGRSSRAELQKILEARDRKAAPGTAPASGLYLEHVFYDD